MITLMIVVMSATLKKNAGAYNPSIVENRSQSPKTRIFYYKLQIDRRYVSITVEIRDDAGFFKLKIYIIYPKMIR